MARKAPLKPLASDVDSAKAAISDLVDGNAKILAGKMYVELSRARHAGYNPRQIATALKAKGFSVTETDVKKALEMIDANIADTATAKK